MSEVIEQVKQEGPSEAEREAHFAARQEFKDAVRNFLLACKTLETALIEMEGAKQRLGESWKKADCPEGTFKMYINYEDVAVELKGDATAKMPDLKLHTLESL